MEDVLDDEGLEDVELEVTVAAADAHCDLISHHLRTNHSKIQ